MWLVWVCQILKSYEHLNTKPKFYVTFLIVNDVGKGNINSNR